MPNCPACGAVNADDVDFCAACGNYLRWDQTGTDLGERSPAPEPPRAETQAPVEPDRWPGEAPRAAAPPFAQQQAAAIPAEAVLVTLLPAEGEAEPDRPLRLAVEPGAHAEARGLVRNQTSIVDTYDLAVRGLPDGWATVDPPTVNLLPFGASESGYERELLLRLHPPRVAEAAACDWPFELVATKRADGSPVGKAGGTLVLGAFHELALGVRPTRVEGRDSAGFQLVVSNRGNAPADVTLRGEDPEAAVTFAFAPPLLRVTGGDEGRSAVRVEAPAPPRGAQRERRLTFHAAAGASLATADASFLQAGGKPVRWRYRLVALRILLTLIGAACLIGGAFGTWASFGSDHLSGLCRGHECLRDDTYVHYVRHPTTEAAHLSPSGPLAFAGSVGFVALVLGLLALFGLRTGRGTWVAGFLAVIGMIGYVVTIHVPHVGLGAWTALAGGALAAVAGLLPSKAH